MRAELFFQDGDLNGASTVMGNRPNEGGFSEERLRFSITQAFANLHLGDQKGAEQELIRILNEVSVEDNKHDGANLGRILEDIENEASYWHANALLHLGEYQKVKDKIEELFDEDRFRLDAVAPTSDDLNSLVRSANMLRLRSLAIASLGLSKETDALLESALDQATKQCEKLLSIGRDGDSMLSTEAKFAHRATSTSIKLARSRILALRGDNKKALLIVSEALSTSVEHIGDKYMLTLEVAVLAGQLQIATSQVARGQDLIAKSLEIITRKYGSNHPLALEASYALISAAQAEGRLTQALGKSQNLCKVTSYNIGLGQDHPLVLRCKAQLGTLHIQCGNYRKAERVLKSAYDESCRKWSDEHPEVMRLRSKYALARYHAGKIPQAWEDISAAIRWQLRVYLRVPEERLWEPTESPNRCLKGGLLLDLRTAFKAKDGLADPTVMSHPHILDSLLTLGKVALKLEIPDRDLAVQVFHSVWSCGDAKLWSSSDTVLEAALTLGTILPPASPTREIQAGNGAANFTASSQQARLRLISPITIPKFSVLGKKL
ncbi:hypothetical protein CORC01_10509 [Colletotrichum orchidophilum]|uniref:Uncharacterized protein n=1 Tax=Colletotrichum orchidophilum TaxID=1209926 RepID=A0A1G4AYG1_9PEZI|nr:uncharacterized protein CORC01_10509 [Colletotrichum orchidophilum]OHE94171.1 hypothetical protein CORC01_10509 [Colletotrichum orchidophilum]